MPETEGVKLDAILDAGERLPGMAALWAVATPEERRELVAVLMEPGGLYYDLEGQVIAAIKPRPVFLQVLRLMPDFVKYQEATGTLVTLQGRQRDRRETASLSPLRWVPLTALLLSPLESIPPKHPHINPPPPPFKVPRDEWPRVVQRVAQGESLRQVARSYRVSYEAIRRILAAVRKGQAHGEEDP